MPRQATLLAETPIGDLGLSVRAYNCLILHSGIKTVGELAGKSDAELLRIKNFGRKSLREVGELLKSYKPEPQPPPQVFSSCRELLATLDPKKEKIIRLRYAIGCEREHTLQEIAEEFGVTRERIRQILAKGMRHLRYWMIQQHGLPEDTPSNIRVHLESEVGPVAAGAEAQNTLQQRRDLESRVKQRDEDCRHYSSLKTLLRKHHALVIAEQGMQTFVWPALNNVIPLVSGFGLDDALNKIPSEV